jgi:transmembrane sensor
MQNSLESSLQEHGLDWPMVARYVAGTASADETARLRDWLGGDLGRRREMDFLRTLWRESAHGAADTSELATPAMADAMIARLRDGVPLAMNTRTVRPILGATSRSRQRRTISAVIAGVGVAMMGAFLLMLGSRNPTESVTSPIAHTYTTAVGEQAKVTFVDGSQVTLAPQSRLSVSRGFGTANRDLELSGEAYFNVAKTSAPPFTVRTGAMTMRVLGTTFNVRRYPAEPAAQVTVYSGKVTAGGRRTSVTLGAGTIGHITDSTASSMVTDNSDTSAAWTRGRLVFKNTPVPVMLTTVGRWYGYEFRLADSALATQDVSAVFNVSPTDETLFAIRELLDVTMTFKGRVVTLRPRPVGAKAPSTNRGRTHFPLRTEVGR